MIFDAAGNLLPDGKMRLEHQHDRSHERALRQGHRVQKRARLICGVDDLPLKAFPILTTGGTIGILLAMLLRALCTQIIFTAQWDRSI